ncbi:zinc ribbon domain-containing protein [Amycolatopsis sp. NPDC003861]
MSSCAVCERELEPQARFCGTCGTPVDALSPAPSGTAAGSSSRKLLPLLAAGSLVALAAAGAVIFAVSRSPGPAAPAAQPGTGPVEAPTQPWAPATSPDLRTTWSPPSAATSSTTVTEADLRDQVSRDHDVAESLIGRWLPQLSSKAAGLVVNGVTYDDAAVLADFRRLREKYPDAFMVDSGDYRNFSRSGYWVTLEGQAFPSADDANAWCGQQGFARQDCHASRLTHTGGPSGNSKPR